MASIKDTQTRPIPAPPNHPSGPSQNSPYADRYGNSVETPSPDMESPYSEFESEYEFGMEEEFPIGSTDVPMGDAFAAAEDVTSQQISELMQDIQSGQVKPVDSELSSEQCVTILKQALQNENSKQETRAAEEFMRVLEAVGGQEGVAEAKAAQEAIEKAEQFIKQLEQDLTKDDYLSDTQRDAAKKKIKEVRKELEEDPTLNVEAELDSIAKLLKSHASKAEAVKNESSRGAAKASDIAFIVNGEVSTDADYWNGDSRGLLTAFPVIGNAYNIFSEEGAPTTGMINGGREIQNLDLAMQGKTGLENSQVPGQVVEILYDTGLSAEEQINAIKTAVGSLPPASQTWVLGRVVKEIQAQDPQKLDFLAEHVPEVLSFLKEEITFGKSKIESGSLETKGTRFTGAGYARYDTDTHWYTNDWSDVNLPFAEMTQGMTDALHAIDGASSSAAKAAEEDNIEF